jgi:phosphate ABC transporter phosphate-binding protein
MNRHPNVRRLKRRVAALLAALGALAVAATLTGLPAQATSYVPVSGAGSTWSQNAIDQWRRNVAQYGLTVNYQGTGSSDGRNQFRNGTVDFGVSEIPYGLKDNGVTDSPPTRPYAYMPIVAGGTSIMYNLKIGTHRVTNLRLSGDTLTKIFTGVIKTWNDPAIKADNPGLALPARPVVPVVRSDGSGTTAQFTLWMSKLHQSVWDAYCRKAGRATPCGLTSNYPVIPGSGFTAQSGSLGVAGYVSQAQNVGTITYVEYSYALNSGFPVAKLLNQAGYYVEPTADNVAVALLKAQINKTPGPNFLTQILDGVYVNPDRRTYPMSSYSYMIIPTATTGTFDTNKGKSLSSFANYFLCEGQQSAAKLGFSPLPVNLVQAGLDQVKRIPGAVVANIDIKKCDNPTLSAGGGNALAKSAPYPPPCDKQGPTQCATGTGGASHTSTPVSTSGATSSPTAGATATSSATQTATAGAVDPDTGQVLAGGPAAGVDISASPVSMTSSWGDKATKGYAVLAVVLMLLVVLGPPVLIRFLRRGRAG